MSAITFVQWSDDSAIFTLPVTGAIAWWDATQITGTADGTPLSNWPDSSGNGNNITQGTTALQPVYYSSAPHLVNGRPTVWWGGLTNQGMGTALILAQPYTVVAVAQLTDSHGSTLWGDSPNQYVTQYLAGGSWAIWASGAPWTTALGPGLTQPHFTAAGLSTTASYFQQDATNVTNTLANQPLGTGFWVGNFTSGVGSAWMGPICEMLISPRLLTSTELASLHAYAQSKWGTP